MQNYLNKNRSSILGYGEVSSSLEETFRPISTPIQRRRMPQIPTKRSMSRQSSLNDENSFDRYRTPENTSHRGASLPPTPTKTPKILSRITNQNKPFNSLPPTPGRQLPKPNLTYRCAKGRRNSVMKRTTSVEYTEGIDNYYDNNYMRPGAVSAREVYNEDYYNYAYQSSDNLPLEEADSSMIISNDNKSNLNAVQDYTQNSRLFNRQFDDTYVQDEGIYQDQEYYDTSNEVTKPRKPILGHSLFPRNADSLESRDDEFKDSFETAISSISSSLYHRGLNSNYVTSAETITANTTPLTAPSIDNVPKTATSNLQYKKDHVESPSNLYTSIPNEDSTGFRSNLQNRGYLKQQESVDSNYFQQYVDDQPSTEYRDKQGDQQQYLEQQDSIESYTEEAADEALEEHSNKAINNRESPASVIHMERFEDDGSLRRGSSQLTVIDPYHPMHQSSGRRPSVIDSRRTSGEVHQAQGADETYSLPSPRKSSMDPYQSELVRAGSIRRSPTNHQEVEKYKSPTEEDIPEEEKKGTSFEEEQEVKAPRPQITAQQRWLWAYNKIIMQLNVST